MPMSICACSTERTSKTIGAENNNALIFGILVAYSLQQNIKHVGYKLLSSVVLCSIGSTKKQAIKCMLCSVTYKAFTEQYSMCL